MVIFRPIKKWLIPLAAIFLGTAAGFVFFPSQQEYHYKSWQSELNKFSNESYQVSTGYKLDGKLASESTGAWSKERSEYKVSTPVSDESTFTFTVFFSKDQFYVQSGGDWNKGQAPHRVLNELAPLDDMFEWSKTVLKEADEIKQIKKQGTTVYTAVFHAFDKLDFRGIMLEDQKDSTLVMTVKGDQLSSIVFHLKTKRPEDINVLQSYPAAISYDIHFSPYSGQIPDVPEQALQAPPLE